MGCDPAGRCLSTWVPVRTQMLSPLEPPAAPPPTPPDAPPAAPPPTPPDAPPLEPPPPPPPPPDVPPAAPPPGPPGAPPAVPPPVLPPSTKTQFPTSHRETTLQLMHVAPARPHADEVFPDSQTPSAEQHPVQLRALQDGRGEPQPDAEPSRRHVRSMVERRSATWRSGAMERDYSGVAGLRSPAMGPVGPGGRCDAAQPAARLLDVGLSRDSVLRRAGLPQGALDAFRSTSSTPSARW